MSAHMGSQIHRYIGRRLSVENNTPLFESAGHSVYWLGITDVTAFRCNT